MGKPVVLELLLVHLPGRVVREVTRFALELVNRAKLHIIAGGVEGLERNLQLGTLFLRESIVALGVDRRACFGVGIALQQSIWHVVH